MYGGGIYAYQSVIDFTSDQRNVKNFIINSASRNGGGVYAVASTIKLTHSYVIIGSNTALFGGGIYLERNSQIYLFKQEEGSSVSSSVQLNIVPVADNECTNNVTI